MKRTEIVWKVAGQQPGWIDWCEELLSCIFFYPHGAHAACLIPQAVIGTFLFMNTPHTHTHTHNLHTAYFFLCVIIPWNVFRDPTLPLESDVLLPPCQHLYSLPTKNLGVFKVDLSPGDSAVGSQWLKRSPALCIISDCKEGGPKTS